MNQAAVPMVAVFQNEFEDDDPNFDNKIIEAAEVAENYKLEQIISNNTFNNCTINF